MRETDNGWLSSLTSSHSPGKKPLLINQRLERETGRSSLLDFFIQMVLRFIICSMKQHMQSQKRLGERLWSPRVGSPGFASPFLHLATSQAGFQLQLLFPVRRLPYPPRLLCRDWGSSEAQRKDDNFQPAQLWLGLQRPEFWKTLCKFLVRKY